MSLLGTDETRTRDEREARRAEGLGVKATTGAVRWLETEGSEDQAHDTGRSAWPMGVFMVESARRAHHAEVRAPIVASKPGNAGGAKGCRKVETR